MTGGNGNGERIGSIVGLGRLGKVEDFRNHVNNLLFVGTAVTRDGLFDLVGSNFDKVKIVAGGGKQDNSARLRNRDCRRRILAEKEFLDGYNVGVEVVNERVEFGKDFKQTVLHKSLRACGDNAVVNRFQFPAQIFNKAKAANGSTWVNA